MRIDPVIAGWVAEELRAMITNVRAETPEPGDTAAWADKIETLEQYRALAQSVIDRIQSGERITREDVRAFDAAWRAATEYAAKRYEEEKTK